MFAWGGLGEIQAFGIFWIETLGSYLLSRCFIRTPEQFCSVIKILFYSISCMTPFLIYENVSGSDLIIRILGNIGPTVPEVFIRGRLDLDRAQGPFEHPILLGVFCGSLMGLTYFGVFYKKSAFKRIIGCLIVIVSAGTSLSSGPISGVVAQISLIAWDRIFAGVQARWKILAFLSFMAYIVVDMLSNRTPFMVLISYFALNVETGYDRVRIWHWGWVNILEHPIFGIGVMNDWERYWFMSPSFDMFWLYNGMYYGIPCMIFYLLAFFIIIIKVARNGELPVHLNSLRKGYIISMAGYFICGWMVHYWAASYALFIFMMASGAWMMEYRETKDDDVTQSVGYDTVDQKVMKCRRTVL